MSALPVEATESDSAASSLKKDETSKNDSESIPVQESSASEKLEVESKDANGSEEATEGKADGKPVKNGTNKKGESPQQSKRTVYDNKNRTRNNSKYDPSVLETTSDHKKIRAQVEFYFGDANLPTDKHMWELTDGSTNLPVAISELCKFGRMKRFQPYSEIVAALRESPFLEVSGPENQEQVKRKVPYDPNAPRNKTEARSVYVKGFGDEEPSSQFDIEAFFAPYGPTNAVRLRRSDDKLFKGSVFVEFADEETAQKFLSLDPRPLWKGKHELEIKSKKEYMDEKQQDIKDGKMEPAETWAPRGGRGRGGRGGRGNFRGKDRDSRDRGRRDGGDRDPDDWKKRREEDRAAGFKDDRRKNDRGDRRGGHRGGRRGGRDETGPRNNDRNLEQEEKDEDKSAKSAQNDKKRARDGDDAGNEAPAKKVDTKTEAAAGED